MTDRLSRSQIILQAATALGWSVTPLPEGNYCLTPPTSTKQLPVNFNARGLDWLDDGPTARAEMGRVLGELTSKRSRADSDDMDVVKSRLAALETWSQGINKTIDHMAQMQSEMHRAFDQNFPRGCR